MSLPSPVSDATSFSFDSDADNLTLNDRALPYRPLVIGSKQRAEFTWFPGSPSAVVQMLGPQEEPITINGFWKDKFLYNDTSALYNASPVKSAAELVDVVDRMRLSGRFYKMAWDKLVRFGHITSFRHTWHNAHDVEWELEFSVSALDSHAEVVVTPNKATPMSLAAQVNALGDELLGQLDAFKDMLNGAISPLTNITDGFQAAANALDDVVTGYVGALQSTADQVAGGVFGSLDASRRAVGVIGKAMDSIAATSSNITDRAIAEMFAFSGGQDNSPIGQQLASYSYADGIRNGVRGLQSVSAVGRQAVQQQVQQNLTASFTAPADIDFRDISTQFYGTPNGWMFLMNFNGYTDSRVHAGDLIWIPPAPTGALASGGDF